MASKFALLGTLLLASSALADHTSQPGASLDHRDDQSQPFGRAESLVIDANDISLTETISGSLLTGETFYYITATFIVPTLTGSDGSVLISEGIDSGGCYTGALWVGIQGNISSNKVSWSAWCQWLPNPRVDFNINMKSGDIITVTINMFTATRGKVILENRTTLKAASQPFDTTDLNPLCMASAGWGVQAIVDEHDSLVSLANFGTVTFTDAMAKSVDSDITYHPFGPPLYRLFGIMQNTLCLATANGSGTTLVVDYMTKPAEQGRCQM